MPMIEDLSRIPVCESEFLQDVSIELGKRLKTVRDAAKGKKLEFRISTTERDDAEWECFDAVQWMGRGEYVQIVVCENGAANYVYREPQAHKHDTASYETYIISVAGWSPYEVADLMRDSLLGDAGVRAIWRKFDQRKKHE